MAYQNWNSMETEISRTLAKRRNRKTKFFDLSTISKGRQNNIDAIKSEEGN